MVAGPAGRQKAWRPTRLGRHSADLGLAYAAVFFLTEAGGTVHAEQGLGEKGTEKATGKGAERGAEKPAEKRRGKAEKGRSKAGKKGEGDDVKLLLD